MLTHTYKSLKICKDNQGYEVHFNAFTALNVNRNFNLKALKVATVAAVTASVVKVGLSRSPKEDLF